MMKTLKFLWNVVSTLTTVLGLVKWLGPKGMAIAAVATGLAGVLWLLL